jgi:hypothetical protein
MLLAHHRLSRTAPRTNEKTSLQKTWFAHAVELRFSDHNRVLAVSGLMLVLLAARVVFFLPTSRLLFLHLVCSV